VGRFASPPDRATPSQAKRAVAVRTRLQFKVYTTGQKRRLTPQIKREFKRQAAIEPVIGHLKEHHRMGRNHLAHASGDAINAVLAAAGYSFRRLLAWLKFLLFRVLIALAFAAQLKSP
jgi:transposase, IS5 family